MNADDRFLRIGHRGAAALEPENTLLSIERALTLGVDMVEIDARATADGRLVVAHDDELTAVGGEHFRVATLDLTRLRRFDVGKGERVPTVEEALALIRGRALVNLDLKVEGQARQLLGLVRAAHMAADTLVSGQAVTSFGYLKAEEPRLWVGLSVSAPRMARPQVLVEAGAPRLGARRAAALAARAAAVRADALMLEYTQVGAPLVRELHQRKLRVYTWTVDDAGTMVRLKAQGVDGVTSNRVDVLVRVV